MTPSVKDTLPSARLIDGTCKRSNIENHKDYLLNFVRYALTRRAINLPNLCLDGFQINPLSGFASR